MPKTKEQKKVLTGWMVTRVDPEGKFRRPHSKYCMKHFFAQKTNLLKALGQQPGEVIHETDESVILKYYTDPKHWRWEYQSGFLLCKRMEAEISDEDILVMF